MNISLAISTTDLRDLLDHMSSSEDEQVAFLFTTLRQKGEPLVVREIYAVPPDGFIHQSPYHLALTDEVRAKVIGRATVLEACLVEVHSHEGGPPVWFSPTDLNGFEEWVPHVRWRLGGRPYVALVFAGESFDALVWGPDSGRPRPLAQLLVDGEAKNPSGITFERLPRSSRDG